jgi:hypothetical protein
VSSAAVARGNFRECLVGGGTIQSPSPAVNSEPDAARVVFQIGALPLQVPCWTRGGMRPRVQHSLAIRPRSTRLLRSRQGAVSLLVSVPCLASDNSTLCQQTGFLPIFDDGSVTGIGKPMPTDSISLITVVRAEGERIVSRARRSHMLR